MSERKQAGQLIEREVARNLKAKGYSVRDLNWSCRYGELDIVALDDDCLVFVEVRSRRPSSFGTALETVSDAKLGRVMSAAEMYIQEHPEIADLVWRVDIVAVSLHGSGKIAECQHIENAVLD